MKVTIITVTYNSSAYIADCISSVNNQTYKNIEHIIIDGASVDNTMEIIKSTPSRVTQIVSEPDNGIYDAMNKGIKLATGEVIGILNSDDFYAYNEVINDIVKLFESDLKAECLYADLNYVNTLDKRKIIRKWHSGIICPNSFKNGWMPPHPTFFVRKELYKKFGCYNLKMGTAADYELMLRFIKKYKCRVIYLPKVIIHMRTGGVSNQNFVARLKANINDRKAWEINNLRPAFYTFYLKPLRKIFQFF